MLTESRRRACLGRERTHWGRPQGVGEDGSEKSFVSYALVPVGSEKSSAEERWGAGNSTQEHLGPQGAARRAIQVPQTNPAIQRKSQSL